HYTDLAPPLSQNCGADSSVAIISSLRGNRWEVGSFLAPELTQMSTSPVDIEKILQRLELVATRLEAISAQKPTIAPKPSNRSVSSINSNGLYYIHCEITR
uniref:Uncharacterized protein n=1 Tax=Parascaris univalens TaxID=6257 RepID=A0A915CHA7_PARUN